MVAQLTREQLEQRNDIHNALSINVIEKYILKNGKFLDAEEDKDATLCCRNILVFLDQMFAQNRYSDSRLMQVTDEANKNCLMETMSFYNVHKTLYDPDPILTLKFYCILFRNSQVEKDRFLKAHKLCNDKYTVSSLQSTDWAFVADATHQDTALLSPALSSKKKMKEDVKCSSSAFTNSSPSPSRRTSGSSLPFFSKQKDTTKSTRASGDHIMSEKLKDFFLYHNGSLGSTIVHYIIRYYYKCLTLGLSLMKDTDIGPVKGFTPASLFAQHTRLCDVLKANDHSLEFMTPC